MENATLEYGKSKSGHKHHAINTFIRYALNNNDRFFFFSCDLSIIHN